MSKMAQLHADGVTDLHSYAEGYKQHIQDTIEMLTRMSKQEHANLVPSRVLLNLLIAGMKEDLEATDE
jgi:hypothetical protein